MLRAGADWSYRGKESSLKSPGAALPAAHVFSLLAVLEQGLRNLTALLAAILIDWHASISRPPPLAVTVIR